MKTVTIHDSGNGCERLQVVSYGNGLAYNFKFGEAGAPMRNVYAQGDDANAIRDEYDEIEQADPERPCRDIWMLVLGPYLD